MFFDLLSSQEYYFLLFLGEDALKRNVYFILLIALLCCAAPLFGAVVEHVGSYSGWDDLSWDAITGLNDADDGAAAELDFVGDSSNAGAYWADNGTYVFFRFRVDTPTADSGTFRESHFLLIDVDNYEYGTGFGSDNVYMPDYGFVWDSKSNDPNKHGLEMSVLNTSANVWNGINMDDIDGNAGQKLANDINGDGRTTDGYVRSIDGQTTANFGDTTFIDYAVSWDYLETNTDLEKGQDWRVALASIANSTDHNNLTGDIGGGANPSDANTLGWAPLGAVPEPTVVSLLSLSGLAMLIGRRLLPTKS